MDGQYVEQQLLPAPEAGGTFEEQLLTCQARFQQYFQQNIQVPTKNYYNVNDQELVRTLISTTHDLAALEERERHRQVCEEAYREIFCLQDGATYVLGKNGKLQRLMDFQITACYHVTLDSRFRVEPLYQLEFNIKGVDPLCLSEKDFLNNKKSLSALREKTGQRVYCACSEAKTALLVRQAAQSKSQEKTVFFHMGWQKVDEQWKFFQFKKFSSHQELGSMDGWRPLEESSASPAFAAAAAEAYAGRFGAILSPTLRGTLFLWTHVSFLNSLLSAMGSAPKLALGLCCDSQRTITLCADLLSLYGDGMASLGRGKSDFAEHLLRAKDQSVLILDERKGFSAGNVRLLQDAITAGAFCAPRLGEVPFQATVTVFSREASDLICSSNCFTLEVGAEAVSKGEYSLDEGDGISADYFSAFAHFVSGNIRELRTDLERGKDRADELSREFILSPAAQQTLASMLGVYDFLGRFYGQQHIKTDLESIIPDGFQEFLIQALEDSVDRASPDDLSQLFLEVARGMIVGGKLEVRQREGLQDDSFGGVVLLQNAKVFITRKAINKICKSMASSWPSVARALKEGGLLDGKPANKETYLTRVSFSGPDGQRITLRGIKLGRNKFEEFGSPIFEEVEG